MVLSMEKWVGKVAVVTGASSGIGAVIADKLANQGLKVVGLARRKERLDDLSKRLCASKGKFYPVRCDITKEDEVKKAFKWIKENVGPVSILVNNAGTATYLPIIKGNTDDWRKTLDTNIIGLSMATREAVDIMNENKIDGHIVNIGSTLGHYVQNLPIPYSMYTASKFAVTALAEAIRIELLNAKSKIKITNISPGLVSTELVSDEFKEARKESILLPEDIADGIIYVLSTPPHVQVHELMIRPVGEP